MLTLCVLICAAVAYFTWNTLGDDHPIPIASVTIGIIIALAAVVTGGVYGCATNSFRYQEGQVEIAKEKLDSLSPVYAKAQVEAVETELVAYQLARPSFGTSYPAIGVAETIKWYAREVAKLQRGYLSAKSDLNMLYRDANTMLWLIVPWSVVIW